MNKIHRLFRALACVACVAGCALLAHASDRVTLKSGKVVEGTIIREVEGAIWVKTSVGGVPVEEMYGPNDVATIQRDVAAPPPKADPVGSGPAPMAHKTGVPK